MNILLTGVTGIIGREVLAELLLTRPSDFEKVYCPIRAQHEQTASDRFLTLIHRIARENQLPVEKIQTKVGLIDTTGETGKAFSTVAQYIDENQLDDFYVLHLASSTNLSTRPPAEEKIIQNSYRPCLDLFEILKKKIKQYTFVSTAFSCGHQQGVIPNVYRHADQRTKRNYYEVYKSKAEQELRENCKKEGITYQVLRPGIVCGRMLRKPFYYIPKFNVFYAWLMFFSHLQQKGVPTKNVRIVGNPAAGINIISSDYVAKAIVRAFFTQQDMELNLVHSENTNVDYLIATMLKKLHIHDFSFVNKIPESKLTAAEKLYYQTAGNQFSAYLNTTKHRYDVHPLRTLMYDVPEPDVHNELGNLLQYAIDRQFQPDER